MKLIPLKENIEDYIRLSEIIDFDNQSMAKKAMELSKGMKTDIQKAKSIYEFVRDEISHSSDINSNEITYRASDVLNKGHGLCFTKSHLMAAFLRVVGIPAGFCYQKLSLDEGNIFHGLNGVFIDEKWIRLDVRGNTGEINAQFSLNEEKLAYIPQEEIGDVDYPYIYSNPCHEIIEILQSNSKLDEAIDHIMNLI
ncbi:MAG: transglutaminase-like domain-containing protein [Methanobacteriaceae archaeon]|jgi:transglutaminase-like putative cysteine protease|nr:transglutaminase-like domain-containing protein [Methanobacteriaceae archaeon]MDP2835457.1 transglutaminase-like domain-containing protein [Methanobacteriaceae archaeon]MDP3034243.1 transglutaminase-like domain-containing protein [Methanobacteriaceae archaeon]MDP3485854.1 transglutaminase-like domain-containing protein [Methanobacteriaceae archaeon]MDP3622569.1 transglutaminase-like domain-containing protein [Methanobacteriaceae archaeon]